MICKHEHKVKTKSQLAFEQKLKKHYNLKGFVLIGFMGDTLMISTSLGKDVNPMHVIAAHKAVSDHLADIVADHAVDHLKSALKKASKGGK